MWIIENSRCLQAFQLKKGLIYSGVSEGVSDFTVQNFQGGTVKAKENDYIVELSPGEGKYFVVSADDFDSRFLVIQ